MSENISSNNIYQSQIPSLTDAADIQDAFKLYHFGTTTEPANAGLLTEGIAKHLYDLQTLKAPIAGPTFTGTLTAPTINASTALQIGGTAITSTAAELNILDGVTSSTAELNLLDGVTSSTAELNILDGVTSTASEINLVDGSVAGTIVNNKAVIYGAAGQVNATTLQIGGVSVTSTAAELNILDGVTSTAAELNLVDGSVSGTIVNSKAVVYGASGQVNATTLQISGTAITSTATELNVLDGITSTTAELNILDGVTSTTSELNLLDGSSAGTIVNSKALIYGAGGQVNATTLQIAGTNVLAAATQLPGAYGGTGVANTGKTITLGGNLTTSGAHATTLTTTGTTSLTLPTSGTVVSKDGSGNFSAGTITATLNGNVKGNVTSDATTNGKVTFSNTSGTTYTPVGKIFVQATQPASPATGDIWIDT